MAGVDASIPLQVKQPDMIGKISDLTNLARSQTALQSERQSQRQRQGIANFDMQKLIGDDGTIDLNKIPTSGLQEAAGDQYPDLLSKFVGIRNQQLAAKQALIGVNDSMRGSFSDMMGALRSDPDVAQDTPEGRQKVTQAFGQYAQMYGKDAEPVLRAYAAPIQNAPPGKLAQVVQNIQLQATSASDQANRQAPQYTDTGSKLVQTNPYAQEGQAPKTIDVGVSPGQQETTTVDQLGNQYVITRDAKGNIVSTRPLAGSPRSGTGGSGQQGGPAFFAPGERQSIEQQVDANFKNVQTTRTAASQAPQLLDQVRKASQLASETQTGAFSEKKQKLESAIGSFIPGFEGAKDDAAKYDLLNKFLERISSDSANVLGKNSATDAARESIREQFGHTGQVNTAIKEVLKYTESQIAAVKAKADAQEKWLGGEGNGIRNQHNFETQWRQAYDPVVYQLEVASPEERKKIIQGLSKEEAASLSEKRKKLREMGAL